MKRSRFLYSFLYVIAFVFLKLVYFVKISGKENFPQGAALICGLHSDSLDPVFIGIGLKIRDRLNMMAKKELFEKKPVARFLSRLGAFPVDRDGSDVKAVKTAMRYLKNGEKVGIFPEGTRVHENSDSDPKNGAVRIADRMNVPIIPVYIPRNKKPFRRVEIVVGKPYYVNTDGHRMTHEEYCKKTDELMARIMELSPEAA